MHKPHNVVHRAISITTWILGTECFCRSRWKRWYVVTFLDLLAFIYCEGYSAPGVVYVMYERHTRSMCMRIKAVQYVQQGTNI